jgi:hypothetical protein
VICYIYKRICNELEILIQRDLVGCSEEQQIRSGYVILDLESINDLEFFSKYRVYLLFQGKGKKTHL